MGGHGDEVAFHDAVNRLQVAGGQQQALDAHCTNQQPVLQHITGIDCFLVHAGTADPQDRVAHRHVRSQFHVLRRHHGSGGIFRILQDLVDLLAHLRIGLGQDTLYHVRGHLFDNVHRVINVQFVHNLTQFLIADTLDQGFLLLALHFNEAFRGQLLWQKPE